MDAPDPNAYANGAQAASVNARAAFEEHDVDTARKRREFAAETLIAARQRFRELEAAYKLGKSALHEAVQYDQLAAQQLEASLARLAEVRAPLHPVRKTPLELLGLIFEHCWDPLPPSSLLSEKSVDVLRRQRQPFQLAAVCRRWRRASLLHPKAWSCIELRLDGIQKSHSKHWMAYVSCMLGRSASTPLHLRIIRSRLDQPWDRQLITPLAAEMHRCESLLLSAIRVQDSLDPVVSLLTTQTPALHILHLVLPSGDAAPDLPNIIPHAPMLTRVRTSFRFAYQQTLLPAVTFFALYGPIISEARDDLANALSVFPNTEDVSLIDPVLVPPATPNGATLNKVVCNATELRIKYSSTVVDESALSDRLVFPRLDFLYLYGAEQGSIARVHLAHSLLPEAAPRLTEVTVATIAEHDIEPFVLGLRPAVMLSRLNLVRSRIGPHGLRQLCRAFGAPSDGGTWLCPAITVLNLGECTFSEGCALEELVALVERRNRAAAAETHELQRLQRMDWLALPASVDRAIVSRISKALAARAA